jgi:predicted MFS family arabinose efflux permease
LPDLTVARALRATRLQFLALGVAAGTWGTHIPAVGARYGLSDIVLSVVLLAVAVGTVSALFVAGPVIGRFGARAAAAACGLAMGLSLCLLLHYPSLPLLAVAALLLGAFMSLFDVAINTEGSELEALAGRPVMSNLHAMFSVGGMLGAGVTYGLLELGVAPAARMLAVGTALAAIALVASRAMLETHAKADADARHFAWPKGLLLLIGLLVFAGMTAEGVLYDWSVLYLREDIGMTAAHASLGYATFTAAMALARFAGDALRASFRERAVLRTSALVAALAMAMLLLSGERWAAFAGLAAVGAGLAPVAPILFNAATRVPGVSRAAAIASVTTIGYSGFLIGPPIIGSVASQASLAIALWLVVVAAAIVACGAGFVPEQRVPGGERPSLSPPEARSR